MSSEQKMVGVLLGDPGILMGLLPCIELPAH